MLREPIDEEQADQLSRVLKALADPVRLRLLSLIGAHAGGEACVCELVDRFDLSQPTISHHLKVLREAGLIDVGAARHLGLLPRAPRRPGAAGRPVHPARRDNLLIDLNLTDEEMMGIAAMDIGRLPRAADRQPCRYTLAGGRARVSGLAAVSTAAG